MTGAPLPCSAPMLPSTWRASRSIWTDCLARSSGPLLFGGFTIADAFYAPVVTRFRTYGVALQPALAAYAERVFAAARHAAVGRGRARRNRSHRLLMKLYRVGGYVRDALLGEDRQRRGELDAALETDRDWVVVGGSPDEMIARGFRPVGRDFPVFLHPETHEEYALARTERKTAPGYKGFVFHAAPDVSLEADLERRDLTINAMALDEDGRLIDPHNGARDLRAGILRHVSPAFVEDPVRILRLARFAARFPDFRDRTRDGRTGTRDGAPTARPMRWCRSA